MNNEEESEPQSLEQRLKAVIAYVRDCQARVNKGEIMDLQGLDNSVIEICDEIAALPRTAATELEDQMTQLIDDLEELAYDMKEQQDKMGRS
jgi:hypothetical protein